MLKHHQDEQTSKGLLPWERLRRWLTGGIISAVISTGGTVGIVALMIVHLMVGTSSHSLFLPHTIAGPQILASAPVVPSDTQICGSSVLISPWSGSGVPSPDLTGGGTVDYTSGEFTGLPTFGSPDTDFPSATRGVIVAAGANSLPDFEFGAHTLFWFAPGTHTDFGAEAAPSSYYVGGYSGGNMAVLDGGGTIQFGLNDENGHFGGPSNDVTVDYLAFTNYNPGDGAGISDPHGTGWNVSHSYFHDFGGESGGAAQGVGVLLLSGSVTYSCFRNLGQTGVNFFGTGDVISYNEFDHNGTFPDEGGTNAGIKGWETVNADIDHNYFHNGEYGGHGVWLDTDNTGYHIFDNFFAWNAGRALESEISYNGLIEDNTFEYNGWSASDGSGFDAAAIYLNLTGGANLPGSNYNDEVLIQHNNLWDNWEGIFVFAEGDRTCIQPQPASTYCPVQDVTSFSAFSNPTSGGDTPGSGPKLAGAASLGASSLSTNFQYALGDKIGFSSGSQPYTVTSASGPTPAGPGPPDSSATWTIGISPSLTAGESSGASIYGQGSCPAEMPSNATPLSPTPASLGFGSQTMSYFEGCQWRPKNVTVQHNTIHFSPTEVQDTPPPSTWGSSWPLSFGGTTINPANCYSGPNYLDVNDSPPTGNGDRCGFNGMFGSIGSPSGAYSQAGGEWLENAVMSNAALPSPLNNLSAAANDFGGGVGESPGNNLWIANTYNGPIGFRAYEDTISAVASTTPPYACPGVGAIDGFTPVCDVNASGWSSIWHQG